MKPATTYKQSKSGCIQMLQYLANAAIIAATGYKEKDPELSKKFFEKAKDYIMAQKNYCPCDLLSRLVST